MLKPTYKQLEIFLTNVRNALQNRSNRVSAGDTTNSANQNFVSRINTMLYDLDRDVTIESALTREQLRKDNNTITDVVTLSEKQINEAMLQYISDVAHLVDAREIDHVIYDTDTGGRVSSVRVFLRATETEKTPNEEVESLTKLREAVDNALRAAFTENTRFVTDVENYGQLRIFDVRSVTRVQVAFVTRQDNGKWAVTSSLTTSRTLAARDCDIPQVVSVLMTALCKLRDEQDAAAAQQEPSATSHLRHKPFQDLVRYTLNHVFGKDEFEVLPTDSGVAIHDVKLDESLVAIVVRQDENKLSLRVHPPRWMPIETSDNADVIIKALIQFLATQRLQIAKPDWEKIARDQFETLKLIRKFRNAAPVDHDFQKLMEQADEALTRSISSFPQVH